MLNKINPYHFEKILKTAPQFGKFSGYYEKLCIKMVKQVFKMGEVG
jgi:hypothetical protein